MNPSTLRILFAIFLITHGLVTMSLATVPVAGALRTPYFPAWWRTDVDSAWPASRLGLNPALVRAAGWELWLIALIAILALVAAGAGLFYQTEVRHDGYGGHYDGHQYGALRRARQPGGAGHLPDHNVVEFRPGCFAAAEYQAHHVSVSD